jgi:hypothetical protein
MGRENPRRMEKQMTQEEVFTYLDELRLSGKINMLDAVPYLIDHFKITKYDAHRHLVHWMQSFSK